MIRHKQQHRAAWLGLWAMLLVFVVPLFSQLRALDTPPLGLIDLQALHCSSGSKASTTLQPEWIGQLEQCGYCQLLLKTPPLPPSLLRAPKPALLGLWLAQPIFLDWPQPQHLTQPARGPPFHMHS